MRRWLRVAAAGCLGGVLALGVAVGGGCGGGTHDPGAALGVKKGEPWDLVYLSDSSGWGVADQYGKRIERDLGVNVRVHDLATGSMQARTILDALHSPNDAFNGEDLRPLVRGAEVIVVKGGPMGSPTPRHPLVEGGFGGCAGYKEYDPMCPATIRCDPASYRQWEADLVAIYDKIFALRGGRPVILRTSDYYIPWGPRETNRACKQDAACVKCTETVSAAIHRAAAARKVPVAGLLDAFNGPTHDRDMPRKYIIDPDPVGATGVHPSPAGSAAIANILANLGYEPVNPRA